MLRKLSKKHVLFTPILSLNIKQPNLAINYMTFNKMLKLNQTKKSKQAFVSLTPIEKYYIGPYNIGFLWFFNKDLCVKKLETSLVKILESFPILCGRFSSCMSKVNLNNQGINWQVEDKHEENLRPNSQNFRAITKEQNIFFNTPSQPILFSIDKVISLFPSLPKVCVTGQVSE